MIRPRYVPQVGALIVLFTMWGSSFVAGAEQPGPPPPAVKTVPPPKPKPQIIYHLPRDPSYAATLHSQAKNQSHPLPIDNSMPPSLQMSRAAANEAAARAQQEQLKQQQQQQQQQQEQQQQQQTGPKADSPRPHRVKRPKFQSHQQQFRKHGPGKGRGPGASRGKGRKK